MGCNQIHLGSNLLSKQDWSINRSSTSRFLGLFSGRWLVSTSCWWPELSLVSVTTLSIM